VAPRGVAGQSGFHHLLVAWEGRAQLSEWEPSIARRGGKGLVRYPRELEVKRPVVNPRTTNGAARGRRAVLGFTTCCSLSRSNWAAMCEARRTVARAVARGTSSKGGVGGRAPLSERETSITRPSGKPVWGAGAQLRGWGATG
jgi:hypothetical protein